MLYYSYSTPVHMLKLIAIIIMFFFSSSSLWLKNVAPISEVVKKRLTKFLRHEQLLNTELSDGDRGTLKLMRKGT